MEVMNWNGKQKSLFQPLIDYNKKVENDFGMFFIIIMLIFN